MKERDINIPFIHIHECCYPFIEGCFMDKSPFIKERIPPISGLFSTQFMLKRKWILDYDNEVIYARLE
ncbi:MAG: hypothetical protein K5893_03650 [Prevotella sp.]|nr:hypothetical protein [Prevotella sp.]